MPQPKSRPDPVQDFFFNLFGGSDSATQGRALDSKLNELNRADYSPGGRFYNKIQATQGTAAANRAQDNVLADLATSATDYQLRQAVDQQNETTGPGVGSLLTDLLVLGGVGAAVWAFTKFGGLNLLKSLARKNKYAPWAIGGAAILLAFFVYTRFKKTASDAQSTASQSFAGLKSLNPFA